MSPRSLRERPVDLFFVAVCLLFASTSFFVDAATLLATWVTGNPHAWPLAPVNIALYAAADPLLVEEPVFLRVAMALSGFVWGPLYLYMAWGFYTARHAIRAPSLAYGAALTGIMLLIVAEELFSEVDGWRSPNPALFLAFNLPYFLFPLAVMVRMWRPFPFGVPPELEGLSPAARRALGLREG